MGEPSPEQIEAVRQEPWASWWAEDRGAGNREDIVVTDSAVEAWLQST